MKLSRLSSLLLALAIPSIVAAQTVTVTTPNPVNPSGQPKAVGTTFIVNADGSIATIGGNAGTVTTPSSMVTTTQGTAANGATATGNPNLIAGWDGTLVRTLKTDSNSTLYIRGLSADGSMAGSIANGQADAGSPIKVGGFASSTPPTAVATGQRVNGWFNLNGAQVVSGGAQIADAAALGAATGMSDVAGIVRPLATGGMVWNGIGNFYYNRSAPAADATTGTGLLGAGILGQYQATLPTYTTGQFGTLAMTARGVLYAAPLGAASGLIDGVSNGATLNTDAGGSGPSRQVTRPEMFNGATWDRVRGDTTGGLYTQERERSQFFAETPGILAAGAFYIGPWRDGGASPSQWGSFSCFFRSDQSSATNGATIQASADAVTGVTVLTATASAVTPLRMTDRNDMRYHRCTLQQGATGGTVAPTINSSFGQ